MSKLIDFLKLATKKKPAPTFEGVRSTHGQGKKSHRRRYKNNRKMTAQHRLIIARYYEITRRKRPKSLQARKTATIKNEALKDHLAKAQARHQVSLVAQRAVSARNGRPEMGDLRDGAIEVEGIAR